MYLAIDIGASSGRHILGHIANGKLVLEEIHRFKNEMVEIGDQLCWDASALFEEILIGLEKCHTAGKIPTSMGIDTWGVDFVLLDENNAPLGNAVAYRDSRTNGMDEVLSRTVSEEELYSRTGMQKLPFNTIYQLLALKEQNPALLNQAAQLLLIPEYFYFLLTGKKKHEYTNATTTALVDARTKNWDFELIDKAGLPRKIFGEIAAPGTELGNFLPEIEKRVGFNCRVVLPCTHDTGSAVLCVPIAEGENTAYLSSGTWSLFGTEISEPICNEESRRANFTNEGGFEKFRYLKNIMGLWMIQNVRAELGDKYSFAELAEMARTATHFPSRVNVNDPRFIAPKSMTDAIAAACKESGQPAPANTAELAYCIYQSLAEGYNHALQELENLTGIRYEKIAIVGGGSQNTFLNELTAKATGRTVTAGPAEGTAAGNILAQMIAAGELKSVAEARALVKKSFDIEEYAVCALA